jgi:hypothetical protein
MPKRTSRPRDLNQLAKLVVDQATSSKLPAVTEADAKKAAAALLGRLGGLKGGKSRAQALSKKRRSEIARLAAEARWRAERGD